MGMESFGHKSKRDCLGTFPELIAKAKVSADRVFADASIIGHKAIYSRPHGVKHHTAEAATPQISETPKLFWQI